MSYMGSSCSLIVDKGGTLHGEKAMNNIFFMTNTFKGVKKGFKPRTITVLLWTMGGTILIKKSKTSFLDFSLFDS